MCVLNLWGKIKYLQRQTAVKSWKLTNLISSVALSILGGRSQKDVWYMLHAQYAQLNVSKLR